MPRPNDSPDVAASKTLAYILRHGAEKEMLDMRSDGFLKLNDVLARPKMRGIDTEMVLRLVAENAKQRFELFYGYDPSPPRPKAKKGQGQGQGKGKGKGKGGQRQMQGGPTKDGQGEEASAEVGRAGALITAAAEQDVSGTTPSGSDGIPAAARDAKTGTESSSLTAGHGPVDAARVEDLAKSLAQAEISTELPLVGLPRPDKSMSQEESTVATTTAAAPDGQVGEYFIRATQGHSIKLESVAHLEPVRDDEDGRRRAGECVHGTRWELWDTLKSTGLSRMARTHIHLAPALSDHAILPRPNSTLRIYLSVPALLAAGIPLYTSLNGVVLTPGNAEGVVTSEYWRFAERKVNGQWVPVWRDGRDVQ